MNVFSVFSNPSLPVNEHDQKKFWDSCGLGLADRVKELLPLVDVNRPNPQYLNRTALHLACNLGHEEVICCLLRVPGLDLNPRDDYGRTPIWDSVLHLPRHSVTELLLNDVRLDANVVCQGKTLLWIFCFYGHERQLRLLLGRRQLVDTKTVCRYTNEHYDRTTAAQVARIQNFDKLADMVEAYDDNPRQVAARLRNERGWPPFFFLFPPCWWDPHRLAILYFSPDWQKYLSVLCFLLLALSMCYVFKH